MTVGILFDQSSIPIFYKESSYFNEKLSLERD